MEPCHSNVCTSKVADISHSKPEMQPRRHEATKKNKYAEDHFRLADRDRRSDYTNHRMLYRRPPRPRSWFARDHLRASRVSRVRSRGASVPSAKGKSLLNIGVRCSAISAWTLLSRIRWCLEVKSVEQLNPVHRAQLMTYLRISKLRAGLLLNFNVAVLAGRNKATRAVRRSSSCLRVFVVAFVLMLATWLVCHSVSSWSSVISFIARPVVGERPFHRREPLRELLVRFSQRRLRLHAQLSREVGDCEQQVPDFFFDAILIPRVRCLTPPRESPRPLPQSWRRRPWCAPNRSLPTPRGRRCGTRGGGPAASARCR